MSEVEQEQPQDDATVEITGIDGLDGGAADSKTISSAKLLRSGLEPGADPFLSSRCTVPVPPSSITDTCGYHQAARPLWKFAPIDGQVLERDISDNSLWDFATGETVDESLVPLRITWDSLGWHVTVSYDASAQDAGFLLAQRYWPYLPVADAREQLLAQQLAALQGG